MARAAAYAVGAGGDATFAALRTAGLASPYLAWDGDGVGHAERDMPVQKGPKNGTLSKKDPQTGKVTNYTVYDENGNAIKRVDVTGRAHGNVPTPHVVYYERHTNPKTGEVFVQEQKTVRPAKPDEIP